MKRNQKIILTFLVVTLFLSVTLTSVKTLGYDWNFTTTMGLVEHDNTEYGYLLGNHLIENQYLEAEYATDIRYVREGVGTTTDSMNNNSKEFRTSLFDSNYRSFNKYDPLSNEWLNLPTYIQASNNTGVSPRLNFTVGYNDKGTFSLKSRSALEMEADVIYQFKVNLRSGKLYDLNIKSTDWGFYYVSLGETSILQYIFGFNDRTIQPLYSLESGEYSIYFYSWTENYVIFEPREIAVNKVSIDKPVSSTFANQPDEIWNETIHDTEENKNKEKVHAYFLNVPEGDYQFKYIRFDTIWTEAYILPNLLEYSDSSSLSYMEKTLGSGLEDKYNMHFEEATNVLVFIVGDIHATDYLSFDYIFSVTSEEFPTLEPDEEYQYQDDLISFGINVEQTQMIYLNWSLMGTVDLDFKKYIENNIYYTGTYAIETYVEDTDKLILEPGYYYFMYDVVSSYDFYLEYNFIDYEMFNTTMIINLEQENGNSSNYKLVKFELPQFEFSNYNFTFTMPNNYTVDLRCDIYAGIYPYSMGYNNFRLGTQEQSGVWQAFPRNDSQELVFYGLNQNEIRYALIYVRDVYNNTGAGSPPGVAFVNQTLVTFSLKKDFGYPNVFNSLTVNQISADLSATGNWTASYNFYENLNDKDLYIINTTAPEYTWYKIRVYIVNGTRDTTTYDFQTIQIIDYDFQHVLLQYFYQDAVWNKYYYKDDEFLNPGSATYFDQIDDGFAPDNYTYVIEFGILDPNLVFMFAVDHTGLNGSISIEFIPYSCSGLLGAYELGVQVAGLSTGAIVALAIIGGAVVVGTVAFIIVRVVLPKRKTPY